MFIYGLKTEGKVKSVVMENVSAHPSSESVENGDIVNCSIKRSSLPIKEDLFVFPTMST